jgi:hypothetical protein
MTPNHILAALAACTLFTAYGSDSHAQTARKLRPDQIRAVETVLAGMEPAMRPLMRDSIADSIAPYSEAQVKLMMQGIAKEAADKAQPASDAVEEAPGALSPEDFEYNRKQFEPAIRTAWAAQKAFDDYTNAKLAEHCPKSGTFARYGSAWRYDFIAFQPVWPTASDRPEIDVAVFGSSYAPQDGRYDFDFSKVRMTFDKTKVDAAVTQACREYAAQGKTFLAKLDAKLAANDHDGAFKLEMSASGWIAPVRERLETVLKANAPSADYALLNALQNGKRVSVKKKP